MFRVLFIVPYDAIQIEVDEVIRKHQNTQIVMETTHVIGVKETMALNLDVYDLVIARGITYATLKKVYPDKHLIEISVTGYELIKGISDAKKKYNPDKVAVVGWKDMIASIRELDEISTLSIECFDIKNDAEAKKKIELVKQKEIPVVVGGLTACKIATSMGLSTIFIKTNKETVEKTVIEAINTAKIINEEQNRANLLRTILDYSTEAVLSINEYRKITTINKLAKKILNIAPSLDVIGMDIEEIILDQNLRDIMNTTNAKNNIIQQYAGSLLTINSIPIKIKGKIKGAIKLFQQITKIQEVEGEIRKTLYKKGLISKYTFESIIGESYAIKQAINDAYKYSQAKSNILIFGETGTGKELFAQSIHSASNRKKGPFVAVNCAALPENLLETELFGYVEGAFTGALKGGKIGLFELAHTGTIFLDEINEVSLNLQSKLLRVLEEKEIRRVGDSKVINIDVRIIAATNANLYKKIELGQFRRDLLYRLNILDLRIPPLRERGTDILLLTEFYIEKFCNKLSKAPFKLDNVAKEAFLKYNWPGNIRELKNICERLAVLNENKYITKNDFLKHTNIANKMLDVINIPNQNTSPKSLLNPDFLNVGDRTTEAILEALEKANNNKTLAAKMLGISRSTLWRKIKEIEKF
ncbi:hypothetical protein AN639_10980 [Candidatus Epulonipiscium fishelsonii]|uniref:Uncharacterized protein n=1 Tax=Candidatus Epulonipiscium fishelsonii TaxID=77094 RepID=A0ACC8XCP0_9FIRM|nr:hypothetical protein AN396_05805 [Epulopiscium sp. SCG-B11WGA-EpuloA1]ONI43196.1 hypothetical protein AN639_10980 [Epulopiscium sp. SCG-B05WGA-EpuloA1]